MNIVCYYIWIIWSAEHRRIKKPSNICGFDGTIENIKRKKENENEEWKNFVYNYGINGWKQ